MNGGKMMNFYEINELIYDAKVYTVY